MPIQNEKFSLLVSNSSGNPLTGALVELRKDATIYTTTEVGNGWYSIASIPTGKYSVFVDSVDTGETKAVGSGQVAALGNTADNVPVSNATEYDFQDPTTLKTTLSLENVANVEVPEPTGSDANKVIQVDSNGDYVLSSIAASGFESIYEILTTSDLTAALSAEYDSKLLVITREDFNFANAQTFEVWGSCSIIVANTSESFQWSSNAVNATFNLKSGADSSLTGMFFLNGVIAFGDNSDYTLNIPWKVTNLDFISPEVSRSVDGSSTLTYESLKASIPASVTVTTAQDWWQNSAGDKIDSVVAGTNITIDNTDPQNPIINGDDPDLTDYVTTNTAQTITSTKTFNNATILVNRSNSQWGAIDTGTTYFRLAAFANSNLRLQAEGSNKNVEIYAALGDVIFVTREVNFAQATKIIGAKFGDKIKLETYTNASPTNGDIWYDGNSTNVQGDVDIDGHLSVNMSSTASSSTDFKAEDTTLNLEVETNSGWARSFKLIGQNTSAEQNEFAVFGALGASGKNITNAYFGVANTSDNTTGFDSDTLIKIDSNGDTTLPGALDVNGGLSVNASNINFSGLPTSSSGLSSGDLWRDGTDLKIVP